MQRINTAYFYRLADRLIPLKNVKAGDKGLTAFGILYSAYQELDGFLTNDLIPPFTCAQNGRDLLASLRKPMDEIAAATGDVEVQWMHMNEIVEALNRFEITLQSDMGNRDTFVVSPKGAYSTTLLAERGEAAASQLAHTLAPDIARDLHDGCRSLAFELPTAAAFHFFRAIEAMVVAYGGFVRSKAFTPSEKKKGLGGYANLLKEASLDVDERIIHSIEQISKLHRNPTMHPERHISTPEALSTFAIVLSTIDVLALDWTRRQTTPDVPLIDILPDDSRLTALLEDGSNDQHARVRSGNEKDAVSQQGGLAKTSRNGSKKATSGPKAGA